MPNILKQSALTAAAILAVAGATSMTVSKADLTVKATVDVTGMPTFGGPGGFPGGFPGGPGGPGGPNSSGATGGANAGGPGAPPEGAMGGPGGAGGPGFGGFGGGFGGFGQQEKYPQTITVYYKGSSVRTEAADGTVTIYNARRGHTYVLDANAKTYYIRSERSSRNGGQGGPGGGRFGQGAIKSTIAITPADTKIAENSKTIAGQHAVKSIIAGDWSMNPGVRPGGDQLAPASGGAGQPPADGPTPSVAPNGETGAGAQPPAGSQSAGGQGRRRGFGGMPASHVEGVLFSSDTIALPSTDKTILATLLDKITAGARMARTSIEDQIIAAGQLPLKAYISVTMGPRPGGDNAPPPPNGDSSNSNTSTSAPRTMPAMKPVTTTFEVKSVSTSDLSDDLFKVPDDYTEVDAPSGRGGGGFGGFGGFGGGAAGGPGGNGGPGGGGPGGDGGGPGGPPPAN